MTDRTQYLLELVKRYVKAYIANPKTKAVMVTGNICSRFTSAISLILVAIDILIDFISDNYNPKLGKLRQVVENKSHSNDSTYRLQPQ